MNSALEAQPNTFQATKVDHDANRRRKIICISLSLVLLALVGGAVYGVYSFISAMFNPRIRLGTYNPATGFSFTLENIEDTPVHISSMHAQAGYRGQVLADLFLRDERLGAKQTRTFLAPVVSVAPAGATDETVSKGVQVVTGNKRVTNIVNKA